MQEKINRDQEVSPQVTHHTGEREQTSGGRLSRRTLLISLTLGLAGGAIQVFAQERVMQWWSASHRPDPLLLSTYQNIAGGEGVAWSPDSRRIGLVVSEYDNSNGKSGAKVIDAIGGENMSFFRWDASPNAGPQYVAWSPDGKEIAGSGQGKVQIWNVANGSTAQTFAMSAPTGLLWLANPFAWSPDNGYVASVGDTIVQVWDVSTGSNIYTYKGHVATFPETYYTDNGKTPNTVLTNEVYDVAWSPDSRRIASCAQDKTVQVWNALDGGNVFTYSGQNDYVNAVAWSPDGTRIASAGNKDVHVWDAADGGNVLIYRGHPGRVNAVAWSPDSKRIVSASGELSSFIGGEVPYNYNTQVPDNTLQVWDAMSGKQIYTYRKYPGYPLGVADVAWSPDGSRIVSVSVDGTVQVWRAP